MRFDVLDDCLKIRHNGGKVFQYEHVDAITTIGHSTKDVNDIGKFGVGFKTVFNITNCPEIHSGKYHFKIEDYIVPKAVEPTDTGKETVFIFPFKSGDTKEFVIKKFEKIKTESENLLFLDNIKEVTFSYNGEEQKLKIKKSSKKITAPYKDRFEVTEATAEDKEGSWSFLIIKSKREIQGTKHKAQIAFRMDEEEKGFIKTNGNIFVFFPTSEQSDFSFFIHAPYKTTTSRETIDFDDKDNKEITKKLAELIADSLPLIRDLNLLTPHFLNKLLPFDKEKQKEPYMTVHKAVVQKLETDRLLPGFRDGEYLYAKESLYPEKKKIAYLLNSEEISKQLKGSYDWLSDKIQPDVCSLLCIKKFTLSDFADMVGEEFIKRKPYKWLDSLYKFILDDEYKYKLSYLLSDGTLRLLKEKPIVPLQNGKENRRYVSPFDRESELQVFMPYSNDSSEKQSSFHIIDTEILKYESAKRFFDKINIDEPNEIDEIKKSILTKYKNGSRADEREYKKDILFIAYIYSQDKDEKRQEIVELLKTFPIILTENKDFITPPSDGEAVYLPSDEVRTWFGGNKEISIVKKIWQDGKEEEKIIALLRGLNCSEKIKLFHNKKWKGKDRPCGRQCYKKAQQNDFNPCFYIDGLEHSLAKANINLDRSNILWKILLQNPSYLKGTIVRARTRKDLVDGNGTPENICSKAGKIIFGSDWLYNKKSKLIPRDSLDKSSSKDLHDSYFKGDGVVRYNLICALGMEKELYTAEEVDKKNKKIAELEKDKKIDKLKIAELEKKLEESTSRYASGAPEKWKPEREPDGLSKVSKAITPEPAQFNRSSQQNSQPNEDEDSYSQPKVPSKEVGDWGEEEVFEKLKEKYPSEEVEWVNNNGEASKPFDILIKRNGKPGIYVEVKTTEGSSPHTFRITSAQWNHARKCQSGEIHGEYHIYAVFNAGKKESSISVLKNPVEEFKNDKLDAHPLGLKLAEDTIEI